MKYHENSFLKAKHLSEGEIKLKSLCCLSTISSYSSIQAYREVREYIYSLSSIHLAGQGQICSMCAALPNCTTAPQVTILQSKLYICAT